MKLNPTKYAFGVTSGKFLGFLISQRGIEANPEKIKTIIDMRHPDTKKEAKQFSWPDECRQAFEELKKYLASPPLLVRPEVGEAKQFSWPDECRQAFEELKKYLASPPLLVRPEVGEPLRAILHRPDTSGRLAKWAVKLGKFDIQYRPRPALKAQVLVDFIAECPTTDIQSGEDDPVKVGTSDCCPDLTWVLHIDGASNAQGSGAGFLLIGPEGVVTEHALRFDFKASNNQAEYEALVAGLKLALELGIDHLQVFSDSQLIVGQTKDEFETRNPTMAKYHQKADSELLVFTLEFGGNTVTLAPQTVHGFEVREKLVAQGDSCNANLARLPTLHYLFHVLAPDHGRLVGPSPFLLQLPKR
ncbi:uncharacterized protein [Elaeis guineensis]|uniref:uncharacterized protein n=1 Tax=Elaeis guineensis var. tenera TaxID=51953 RepID=UPI003C6D280E